MELLLIPAVDIGVDILNGLCDLRDVETVTRAVRDMFKDKTEFLPSADVIIEEVGKFYNIPSYDIRGQGRTKDTGYTFSHFAVELWIGCRRKQSV